MEQLNQISKIPLADLLGEIVNELEDWVIVSNKLGKTIYANRVVMDANEFHDENILGQDMHSLIGINLLDDEKLIHIRETVADKKECKFVTNPVIKGNRRVYLANELIAIWQGEQIAYYVCISKDITSTQKLKEEIYHADYFDSLTHYPNYKIFTERLNTQFSKAKRDQQPFAVILMDIGRMDEINNVYGMVIGDKIIKEVGRRIEGILEGNEEIFKYKGNAFALLKQNVEDELQISTLINHINEAMAEAISIYTRNIYTEIKTGIAIYEEGIFSKLELLQRAEIALIEAKKKSRVTHYAFYSQGIHEEIKTNLQIESELQFAVEKDEFVVYYQPFVNLKEEKLVGMEALIRLKKENGELIPPSVFISKLERMHLIEKVGMIILDKVCRQLRIWMDMGYEIVPISVNLSAVQFKNPNLAVQIKAVLKKYEIPAEYIVIEVTETAVMEDVGVAHMLIDELKSYGFTISIDDFGTGYASIGYLKKFMFDHLKIDISFIREIAANNEDRAIVEAIISIAKALHLKTIAEGIENKQQLNIMNDLGCEMGQGFLWDRPIEAAVIEDKYFRRGL